MKTALIISLISFSAVASDCPVLPDYVQMSPLVDRSCPGQISLMADGLEIFNYVGALLEETIPEDHHILMTGEKHPIAAMRYNLETHTIEVYDGGYRLGKEMLASSLYHEARHAVVSSHTMCSYGPAKGYELCDSSLPSWSQWREGGSYVYELAFQRAAIQAKIPGYEKYIKQFIGNIHTRFTQKPSIEVLNEWIGSELLESNKDFIDMVRSRYWK